LRGSGIERTSEQKLSIRRRALKQLMRVFWYWYLYLCAPALYGSMCVCEWAAQLNWIYGAHDCKMKLMRIQIQSSRKKNDSRTSPFPNAERKSYLVCHVINNRGAVERGWRSKLNEHIKKGKVLRGSAKEMKLSSAHVGPKSSGKSPRGEPQWNMYELLAMWIYVGESEKFISHPARGHSCPGLMLVYAIVWHIWQGKRF